MKPGRRFYLGRENRQDQQDYFVLSTHRRKYANVFFGSAGRLAPPEDVLAARQGEASG
jgi:hypothetical protein